MIIDMLGSHEHSYASLQHTEREAVAQDNAANPSHNDSHCREHEDQNFKLSHDPLAATRASCVFAARRTVRILEHQEAGVRDGCYFSASLCAVLCRSLAPQSLIL